MTRYVATLIAAVYLTSPVSAQAPSATGPARPRPVAPPAQVVIARDFSGNPIEGVRVSISVAQASRVKTDATGTANTALADGPYRLRFELDRFITLERDVTIRNG